MRSARSLVALASLCVACGDPSPPPLPPAQHTLDDGVVVDVDGTGALTLTHPDGRTLLATAPGAAPTLRSFDETVRETLGSFDFRRTNEVARPLARFTGSERTGDGVVLRFEGEGGDAGTLTITSDGAGRTRLRFAPTIASDLALASIALPFRCDDASTFLGFGAQYHQIDQRGEAFPLFVEEQGIGRTGGPVAIVGDAHTTYYPMPWWIDLRGFGVLIDTPARTLVDLCASDPAVAWVEVEDGAAVEMIVFHGPTPLEVIAQLGAEVGRPGRPPDWALERPWFGIQGGQDAVLAEADALEAAGIPFSALWAQDWSGRREFSPGRFGVLWRWVPDTALYPDLRALTDELHSRGVRFLAYANPFVVPGVDHWDDMAAMDLLVRDDTGAPLTFTSVNTMASLPDFTRDETYDYVESFFETMITDLGIDGWMADYGEWLPLDARLASGTSARLHHNVYPAAWHRASRETFDRLRPDGDYAVFTRSGWTRQQEVAQVVWCGDQEADFSRTDGLPTVVPCMLNLGLSGVPFVTHDVAGFSGGPSTEEVYLRWVELGAFSPIFRTHEGLLREANWSWDRDAATTAHVRRFARVHEALGPELRALADEAAASSAPMVRALSLVFPDDPGSRGVSDEFLLGEQLLVAPVLEEGATRRSVVLPPGTWFHVWTGEPFTGPATIEIDAPIGAPPVFSRDADREDLRAID